MRQVHNSIDFRLASVTGNSYRFSYNVERALLVSTDIFIQNYVNGIARAAWYNKYTKQLYAQGVNGYWTVNGYVLNYVNVPDPAIDLQERVSYIEDYLTSAVVYSEVKGNPVVVSNAYPMDFRKITVSLMPLQSGSGDPSPSNVRAISGVSTVTITRTGESGSNPQTVSVQLIDGSDTLTVYGGKLDATTGTLTVNSAKVALTGADAEIWMRDDWATNSNVFYIAMRDMAKLMDYTGVIVADKMKTLRDYLLLRDSGYCISGYADFAGAYPGQNWLYISVPNVIGVAALKTWLANNPITVVYPLTTPVVYQLSSAQLTALYGYNTVSSNNGTLEVEYRAVFSMVKP